MKGYDSTPLEREKVIEFISRLGDMQKKQRAEFDKLQVRKSMESSNLMSNACVAHSGGRQSKIGRLYQQGSSAGH
jgi:hypothetical protein